MVGAELGGQLIPLGKTDQSDLDACIKRLDSGKELTPKQAEVYPLLIKKRDTPFTPKLSEGALTYVSDRWYGERFDYVKRFVSKQTRKGNERESEAIRQAAEYLGYSLAIKNEKHFENDYIHGTPDWMPSPFVFDTKCVWEPKGLGLFNKKLIGIYEWQIKGYSWLTGREHGAIIRILMNPPESMIYSLAKPLWEEAGYHWTEPITEEFMNDVRHEYDFELKRPINERINIVRVDTTDRDIRLIKQQVELMNNEWDRLDSLIGSVNKEELEFFRKKVA